MNNIFIYEANINFSKTDSCHEKIFWYIFVRVIRCVNLSAMGLFFHV